MKRDAMSNRFKQPVADLSDLEEWHDRIASKQDPEVQESGTAKKSRKRPKSNADGMPISHRQGHAGSSRRSQEQAQAHEGNALPQIAYFRVDLDPGWERLVLNAPWIIPQRAPGTLPQPVSKKARRVVDRVEVHLQRVLNKLAVEK